ncbi:MAG: winged helix-turn-helix transcriptional regulator, partial [Alphaproteobacteria bacterium]|nr:winged helix-turn-helix transcriptional regulator [Alphaproteobacteria bacterium]
KAFDDEKRLCILEMLQSGEKCACVILENMQISQSTLSHHMKILCESGIVNGRKEGKWVHYSISDVGQQNAINLLKKITSKQVNS